MATASSPVKGPKGMLRCLTELRATRSPVEKEKILRRYDSPLLRQVLVYALDPHKVYNVGVMRWEVGQMPDPTEPYKAKQLFHFLDRLARRDLTGHDALRAVNTHYLNCGEWAPIFKHMLLKDLDCGLQVKTVNKVFKGLIKKFEVMRALDYDDYKEKFKPPFIVELKYDGHRITTFGSTGQFLTRNGLEKKGYTVVKQELYDFSQFVFEATQRWPVFDGELMVGMFGNRSSQENNAGYIIFDLLYETEYNGEVPMPGCKLRKARLAQLFRDYTRARGLVTRLQLSDYEVVHTLERLEEIYTDALSKKHEGLMLKTLEGPWEPKRSKHWVKYKPTYSEDLEIVGVYEGEPDTKYVGQLGGIIVRRPIANKELRKKLGKKFVDVRVGGGYSDKQRKDWWKEDQGRWLIGWVAEVEHKQVTPDCSLRHPTFVRLREDK